MRVEESNEWCAIEGNFFKTPALNSPDLNKHNQAMADLMDVTHNDPEDPSIDENSASSVLEFSLESGSECGWDGLEDEWHSNDNGIVALKKILLLERREDWLNSAPVTLWSPFRSKEDMCTR
ncbi:hypothetical protein PCASD_19155 [Puccinia coronata f. sp. avenae]|uniref:Uncharacterized protein n=1 Tax=Puccinia coronata f. sp. avenae TaxID=200324 RepID=A0A2N5TQB5_9BASI|nr:hypothetical protein PCASD_19155 [Puccinia coronata f. sp. avenae]